MTDIVNENTSDDPVLVTQPDSTFVPTVDPNESNETKVSNESKDEGDESNCDGDESNDEGDESNSDSDVTRLLEPLSLTENSDLYVVTVDGSPRFYVKDEKTASDKMWEVARRLSSTQFFAGYRTSFLRIRENELRLLGSFRFFLIAYDTTLHRISYSRVQECV